MSTVIQVEGLSKGYRLGVIGSGTLKEDLQRRWARWRGKPDPLALVTEQLDGSEDERDFIWAVRDINFEVKRGEIVGIVGRNGAGKSTILKILSRITAPTKGIVRMSGRVASMLEVGTGFHAELTGRENVYLNGAILGMTKTDIVKKFDEIVSFSGVEKFIDTPIKRYSSGMTVRLAFAVAAHLDPEILLIDEVLAVGDADFQERCLRKIGDVVDEGRTVLFVSHNMTSITSLCQRGLLLENGRVELDSTAVAVVTRYLDDVHSTAKIATGYISLEDHPGRRKSHLDQVVRLTHCILADRSGSRIDHLQVGEPATIRVGYRARFEVRDVRVTFALIFSNNHGQRVSYLSSEVVGADLTPLSETGEVQCSIPRLPLVPGRYSLTLLCKVGSIWSDAIYDATYLDVVGTKFYETDKMPPLEASGNLLMDYEWELS